MKTRIPRKLKKWFEKIAVRERLTSREHKKLNSVYKLFRYWYIKRRAKVLTQTPRP